MLEKVLKRVGRKLALLLAFVLVINSVQNHVLGVYAEQESSGTEAAGNGEGTIVSGGEADAIGGTEENVVSGGEADTDEPDPQNGYHTMDLPKGSPVSLEDYSLQWKEKSVPYDGEPHRPQAEVSGGDSSGFEITYTVSDGDADEPIPSEGYTHAGSYPVRATAKRGEDSLSDAIEFKIEQAQVKIELQGKDKVLVSQDPGFEVVVKSSDEVLSLSEKVKQEVQDEVKLNYYKKEGGGKGAPVELGELLSSTGKYYVEASFGGTANIEACSSGLMEFEVMDPIVRIKYAKGSGEPIEEIGTLTYPSESGEGSVPYAYLNAQSGGLTAESLSLVIEVEDESFDKSKCKIDTASRWDLEAPESKKEFIGDLQTYLTTENWDDDEGNNKLHRIKIPMSKLGEWTDNAAGEDAANGRYDISVTYVGGDPALGNSAETHVVYDTSAPQILIQEQEGQSPVQKREDGSSSKEVWFFKDKANLAITISDIISGLSKIEVYDVTYQDVTGENEEGEKRRLYFTIDFGENPKGELELENAVNPNLQAEDVTYKYENGKFEINVGLDAPFRGNLKVVATNRAGIEKEGSLQDAVIVADNTSPVLEKISYPSAVRVIEEGTGADVIAEGKPFQSGYLYYYNGSFEVSFQVKEEYLLENLQKELVKVALFSSDTLDGAYEAVPGFTYEIKPDAEGTVKVTFKVGEAVASADGHYKFTISVEDPSGNKMKGNGGPDNGYAEEDVNTETCVYTSPVLTIDTVKPKVSLEGYYKKSGEEYKELTADSQEELFKLLTYGEDPGYVYFNQSDDEEIYLKLQIVEHNFRSVEKTDFQATMGSLLLDGTETDQSALLLSKLTEQDTAGQGKWQTEESDKDIHFLYIPLKDVFEQGRYELESLTYKDLAGNVTPSENSATAKFVYDTVAPEVKIEYSENLVTWLLAKLFAFYHDDSTVTVTVKDDASGINTITISDIFEEGEEELEEYYEDKTHVFFKLDYSGEKVILMNRKDEPIELTGDDEKSAEVDGILVTVKSHDGSISVAKDTVEITFKVPAEFRGKIQAETEDRAGRRTVTHEAEVKNETGDVVMVVDRTSPVLDSVSVIATPGPSLTKVLDGERVPAQEAAQKPLSGDYRYYYQTDEVLVNFDITEANFCEGFDLAQTENFEGLMDLVEVKLYQYAFADAAFEDASKQEISDFEWSYYRVDGDEDTYRFSFALPQADGHYRFTITAKDYSGNQLVPAQDPGALENLGGYTGDDFEAALYTSPMLTIDTTKPVLEKIVHGTPGQTVNAATLETLEEAEGEAYTSQNWYFYDGGISVNFDITEADLSNGGEDQERLEKSFRDIVTVELYYSETLDADPAQYQSLGRLDVSGKRKNGSGDTYACSFNIPADLGDGHYYYTIFAEDHSSNKLVTPVRNGENAVSEEESGYRDDDFSTEAGIYTSPILTIDTTDPVVEVRFVNEKGEVQEYAPTEHEYYGGQYTTIELTVHEHNFRPSDAAITMSAADVNGKADAVDSVINANDWIEETLVGLKDNSSSVWNADSKDKDTYTARIQIQSPRYDANYTFGISYQDMAAREADSYVYNGKAMGGTPIKGDVFTVDSIAPVITVIENSDDSDMRYHDVNTGGWAKFLNYVTFGYFWKQAIRVTVIAHDEISGVQYFDYNAFMTETDAVSKRADVVNAADVEAVNLVQGNNADRYVTFTLSPDFKGDVIASAKDFAANRCANQSLKGVVLESSAQHASEGSHVGIQIQTSPSRVVNGVNYYNSDVGVLFSYVDNYSGLNQVSYTLANSGGNSVSYANENGDITYSDQLSGVVSAAANNSNDVLLTAEYTDNAGYSGSVSERINIDVTAPVISVVYDTYDALNENYYNTVRTAIVTITERNFHESDVEFTITNTDGVMPVISGWTHSAGNGGSDSTTHTCTVTFAEDGDYTFTLECQDFAGNHSSYGVVDEFTIDRTVPEISVSYDNMDSQNTYYYNEYRRATVNILEHNFNPSDVTIVITAENDGESVPLPAVNGWSSNGDMNTATIYYDADAEYTFDISYTDMAGNVTEEFPTERFVVDTIAPKLEITNIENYSANKGTVQPHIIYSDVNMGEYAISLNGYHNGNLPVDGMSSSIEIHNGAEIVLDDLEDIRANDDLYTLRAEAVDLAGNTTSAEVMYSVNRWGSVFILSDDTLQFVKDYYHNQEKDLVVTEINVDTITSAQITYSEHSASEVVTLEEGDYSVESSGGRGTWKQNVYTIFGDNFAGDGQYSVRITSTDAARNEMSNVDYAEDEDAEALLQFVIDKTNPFCTVTGVENGEQYNEDARTVTVTANDNFFLDTLQIVLDGSVLAEYDADMLAENGGKVTQEIGSSNRRQTLEVIAKDKAGNVSAENVMTFLITTNLFYQFINNTTAVVATASTVGVAAIGGIAAVIVKGNMAGAAAAAGGAAVGSRFFFLLFGKKKKKDEEDEEEGNKKG